MNQTIIIPGTPIAQARPRFFRRGRFVGTYNPQETEAGRWRLDLCRQLPPGWVPIKGPIRITVRFFMKRPKSHYRTGIKSNEIKGNAPSIHSYKPDIDNLQKMVFDYCNGLMWVDDALICDVHCRKDYSENPRTEITVEEIVDHEKSAG